jgi:hypothetical protein
MLHFRWEGDMGRTGKIKNHKNIEIRKYLCEMEERERERERRK